MRLWPLIAVLSLLAFLLILTNSNETARVGNLTVWSFGLTVTSLLFSAASVAGALALWLTRKKEMRTYVRWYSIAVTAILLMATAYLTYFCIIGIRTWS
jgi:hypothetical protein